MDVNDLKVKKFNFWTICLHDVQYYLGRCRVFLNRKAIEDELTSVSEEEWTELKIILKNLRKVLAELFEPDRVTYATYGNRVKQFHIHVVPRYKTKRVFGEVEFLDENWGRNHSPYNRNFKISTEVMKKIKKLIKENLEKD
tara:strand:- start:751 stop:1173 length:423 start_codon:yes stop_codon:yes gene_type:complete